MKVLLIGLAIVFVLVFIIDVCCIIASSRCSIEEEKRSGFVYMEKGKVNNEKL